MLVLSGIAPMFKLRLKPTPADHWWLLALAAFGVAALVWGKSLQRECMIQLLLRSNAPSPDVLSDVVKQSRHPEPLLMRFWQTQRIPDRHFVLTYLDDETNLSPAMESLAMQATRDPDIGARKLAFNLLSRIHHPQLRSLALEQLQDADPAVQILGLQTLRSIASSNDVPVAMRLLNDPEPRVVVPAALVLREATGLDFGIKSSGLALPEFTSIDNTNPPPAPDLKIIRRGVEQWQAWWKIHQADYSSVSTALTAPEPIRLATADFSLRDTNGRTVRLSDYRGKVVLLAFWSPDSPFSLSDALALNALRRRHPQRLVILGIAVPPDQDDDDMPDMPGMKMPAPPTAAQLRAQIWALAREKQIRYPLLLDSDGNVGLRFDVEDLPTYVLIDTRGRIVRRFVGSRTAPVLAAMIREVIGSPVSRANALGKPSPPGSAKKW